MRPPLIEALIDMIPDGDVWSLDEQAKWFAAAREAFAMAFAQSPKPQLALPPPRRRRAASTSSTSGDLTESQQAVLEALRQLAEEPGAWVAVSIRGVAIQSGCAQGSVPAILEALEKRKLIEVEHNGQSNGQAAGSLNRYRVVTP